MSEQTIDDQPIAKATGDGRPTLQQRMSYQGILLGTICLGVTLILVLGYAATKKGIEQAALKDKLASLAQVLPTALYDNNPVQDVQRIDDSQLSSEPIEAYIARRGNTLTGVAFQVKKSGYGGPITLIVGIDADGKILGVRVIAHKETPGLADRIDITKDDWITRFDGHSLANTTPQQWHVKKDGGQFDQFTGATITPRAVVLGVYQGLLFHQRHFMNGAATAQQESSHEQKGHE